VVAALLVVLLAVVFFSRALFGGENFVARDLLAFYRPAKSLIAPLTEASGGVPLWNPYFASGQPFAANPEHEMFHPMTSLFLVLPFAWAFRLQVILPVAGAGFAMYAFLRVLRRSRWASLFGGISWATGGYLLSTTNLIPILLAVAVLPLALVFAVRVAATRRAGDVAGLALSFGLIGLAGEPSTLLMTPILALPALLTNRRRFRRAALPVVAAGFLLGATLAAAALLPGAHHAAKTVRAAGLSAAEAGRWSLPVVRLLELFIAHPVGHAVEATAYWGARFYDRDDSAYLYSLYPGLLAAPLAIAAWRTRGTTLRPWLVVACVGTLVALGEALPLWALLRRLPLMGAIRFPEKLALLLALPLVVAAAFGFDQVVFGPDRARRPLTRVLAAYAGIAAAWAAAATLASGRWPAGPRAEELALFDGLRAAAVAMAGWLIFRLWARWPRSRGAVFVCLLAAVDLASAGRELLPTAPEDSLARPPVYLRPLLADPEPHLLLDQAALDFRFGETGLLRRPPGPAEWRLATTLENDFDLTHPRWTFEAMGRFWDAVGPQPSLLSALLVRRGVTAMVRFVPGSAWRNGQFVAPNPGQFPVEVMRASRSRPFAFAAARVELVRGGQEWVAAVRRLGREASDAACVEAEDLPSFPGAPSPAEVRMVERRPLHVHLDVDARGPGPSFVAINQTWDEGWRTTIDAAPARLLRTEIALSGLVVPPGRHRVELTYVDPWVSAGMGVSLGAAFICLALIAVAALRRRRRSAAAA